MGPKSVILGGPKPTPLGVPLWDPFLDPFSDPPGVVAMDP